MGAGLATILFLAIGLSAFAASPAPLPANATATAAAAKPAAWKFSASLGVKETYDSNVYLQSETPKADQSSWVTSFLPQMGINWTPCTALSANLNYTPEITFFHSEPSEDFVAHRIAIGLAGKVDKTAYDLTSSLTFINGSSIGPTWTGPGGAPATGGPAVRDRRDAAVYRTSFKVTQSIGQWFVRPAFSFYLHDFQTEHRTTAGYQNFVDRNEVQGGADFGRALNPKVSLWTGYRFGVQDQSRLAAFPEEYDNVFHRLLFGIDGQPTPWLKLAVAIGPEFRHYGNKVPATFYHRDDLNLFVDASATLTLTKSDTVVLSVKQFDQPGFGGRSTYEDLTCDLSWKHKFAGRWSAGVGTRAYNTDFLYPVKRNDWVLSANVFVNCAITKQLNAEASYVFEDGLTQDRNASGRTYERHLVSLGLKYVFQ